MSRQSWRHGLKTYIASNGTQEDAVLIHGAESLRDEVNRLNVTCFGFGPCLEQRVWNPRSNHVPEGRWRLCVGVPFLPTCSVGELSFGEQSTRVRKGYGHELPARVLQQCLLTFSPSQAHGDLPVSGGAGAQAHTPYLSSLALHSLPTNSGWWRPRQKSCGRRVCLRRATSPRRRTTHRLGCARCSPQRRHTRSGVPFGIFGSLTATLMLSF
jgi:hypothetical protein